RRALLGGRSEDPDPDGMDSPESLTRPIEPADLPALLALNNAHPAEIGVVEDGRLRALLASAALSLATGPEGRPDAFLLAFDHETPSQGPNHAWFLARHPRFLYVDRVCVDPRARRRGL